jgi:hypothetical protein
MTAAPLIDWQELRAFLALIGRDCDPLILSLFPPESTGCNIHLSFASAAAIDTALVERELSRCPEHGLGMVINHPLQQPADWGQRPEHLNSAGRPKAYGASAAHIRSCIGLFCEGDGGWPEASQADLPRLAGLPEPTLTVWSGGKSLHCYWLLQEGEELPPYRFRELQQRLALQLAKVAPEAGIDGSLKDPNQVMRVPGGRHPRTEEHARIRGGSGQRFTVAELEALLPAQEPAAAPRLMPPRQPVSPTGPVPLEALLPRELERLALEGTAKGGRDDGAFSIAVAAVVMEQLAPQFGLQVEGTAEQVVLAFASRCNPPFGEREALAKIASARSSPRQADPGAADRIRYHLQQQAGGVRCGSAAAGAPPPPGGGKAAAARRELSFEERWQLLEEQAAAISAAEWPWMKQCAAIASKASELQIPGLPQRDREQLLEDALRKRRPASEPILPGGSFTVSPSPWAVEGIFRHGLNLLVGQPGAGKSRLAVDVAAAWLRGDPIWLDCELPRVGDQQRHVLIVGTDQGLEDWAQTLCPVGLATQSGNRVTVHERLTLYPLEAQVLMDADGLNNVIRGWVDRHPGGMVLVDSLSATLPAGIDIEKAPAGRPVRALVEALGDGWGILTHHTRKAAGKEGNLGVGAGSGSGQIDGAVSRVVGLGLIHKVENGIPVPQEADPRRELLSTKRGGKTLHLCISSDESGRWTCHGSAEEMKRQERLERTVSNLTEAQSDVLAALEARDGWATVREVVEAIDETGEAYEAKGTKAAAARRVLKRLEVYGLIESRKVGVEGTYRVVNPVNQSPPLDSELTSSLCSPVDTTGVLPVHSLVHPCSQAEGEPPVDGEPQGEPVRGQSPQGVNEVNHSPPPVVLTVLGDPPPPEVLDKLAELRRLNPTASAFTLSLDLEAAGMGSPSGRKVKQWMDWQDRQEPA